MMIDGDDLDKSDLPGPMMMMMMMTFIMITTMLLILALSTTGKYQGPWKEEALWLRRRQALHGKDVNILLHGEDVNILLHGENVM